MKDTAFDRLLSKVKTAQLDPEQRMALYHALGISTPDILNETIESLSTAITREQEKAKRNPAQAISQDILATWWNVRKELKEAVQYYIRK